MLNISTIQINDTNASYRTPEAGDAKNTDLFLDNEHYELFKDAGEQITVRFSKGNLSQAIIFIASILPRKYDNSAMHKIVSYSPEFVYDQLAFLDYFFKEGGVSVDHKTQTWNARKDVLKKNGEIDNRFYFNGLLEEVEYVNSKGERITSKFTIRNYLAGGYSDLHIKRANNGIFDVWVTNVQQPYFDDKEEGLEIEDKSSRKNTPLQTIFYGAPGTGKSHKIDGETKDDNSIRTTFHPDTDYATFVGAYKPMMEETEVRVVPVVLNNGASFDQNNGTYKEKRIVYKYEPQAFLKAYVEAWKKWLGDDEDKKYYLVIEEINRGNCAQIFGDLFQLLDREDDGYSSYAISPESAITKYLAEEAQSADGTKFSDLVFSNVIKKREDETEKIIATADDLKEGKRLVLPPNLHIWATMNTSDQSLFPIDSAFKRRWDWEYVPIKRADKEPENKWIIKVTHDGKTYWCYWWEFLEAINHQIEETTHSEDKQLGYFFAKPKAGENFISTDTFVNKVIFYLWNDVFKDEDSAVFQYDNDKVEDVSINRSGTMYFRHFMENKDEMIHYFINQLFAMGKDNNPVVPIDYLKYDNDPDMIEHLPKMREDSEETPMPTKKGDGTGKVDYTYPEYANIFGKVDSELNAKGYEKQGSGKNSIDYKIKDIPATICYISARLNKAQNNPYGEVLLWMTTDKTDPEKSKNLRDKIADSTEGVFKTFKNGNVTLRTLEKDPTSIESINRGWVLKNPDIKFTDESLDNDAKWICDTMKGLLDKLKPIIAAALQ